MRTSTREIALQARETAGLLGDKITRALREVCRLSGEHDFRLLRRKKGEWKNDIRDEFHSYGRMGGFSRTVETPEKAEWIDGWTQYKCDRCGCLKKIYDLELPADGPGSKLADPNGPTAKTIR